MTVATFRRSWLRITTTNYLQIDHTTGASLTHEQIKDLTLRVANLLIASGLTRGDHVAITLSNHLGYMPIVLGVMVAGGVPALCNPLYKGEQQGTVDCRSSNLAIICNGLKKS